MFIDFQKPNDTETIMKGKGGAPITIDAGHCHSAI